MNIHGMDGKRKRKLTTTNDAGKQNWRRNNVKWTRKKTNQSKDRKLQRNKSVQNADNGKVGYLMDLIIMKRDELIRKSTYWRKAYLSFISILLNAYLKLDICSYFGINSWTWKDLMIMSYSFPQSTCWQRIYNISTCCDETSN